MGTDPTRNSTNMSRYRSNRTLCLSITSQIIFHMLNRTNINSAKYSLQNTNRLAQQKQFVAQIQREGGGGYLLKTYTHYNAPYTPIPHITAINTSHHFICICTLHKQHLTVPAPPNTSCNQLFSSLISQHKSPYCDLARSATAASSYTTHQ